MVDEYLQKDDQGIVILDGNRSGEERRITDDRREKKTLHGFGFQNNRQQISRREPGERRVGPFYTARDIFHEHLSSFMIGIFLILTGILMLVTGLTFLPVVGLYAGILTIAAGCGFIVQAFRSSWP